MQPRLIHRVIIGINRGVLALEIRLQPDERVLILHVNAHARCIDAAVAAVQHFIQRDLLGHLVFVRLDQWRQDFR